MDTSISIARSCQCRGCSSGISCTARCWRTAAWTSTACSVSIPRTRRTTTRTTILRFLRDTPALLLPTAPVGWLVTSRLEKYRAQTLEWLARHKVQFGELRMMQYPDMAARRAAKAYARFKADIYVETGAWLFIESDAAVAVQIAHLSGKAVFCTETREMLAPGDSPTAARRAAPPQEPALGAALRATARAMRQRLRGAYRRS